MIALGLLTVGIMGWAGITNAATTSPNSNTLVDKIAQKFNLKKTDVQAVFDESRQERQKNHQVQMSNNLDKAVTDGVITSEQKQKILDKQAQNQKDRQSKKDEMTKWFSDNGIDQAKLKDYQIGLGHHGRGMRGMHR